MKDLHWHHVRFVLYNGYEMDDKYDYKIVDGDSLIHYALAIEVCAFLLDKYQDEIIRKWIRMSLKL